LVFAHDPAVNPNLASGSVKINAGFPFLAAGCIFLVVGFIGFSIFSIIKSARKSYNGGSGKENSQIS